MRIEIIYGNSSREVQDEMNNFLKDVIKNGGMIIDYGIEGCSPNGIYGFIKYCDKQFLRDYKINSIMNEL